MSNFVQATEVNHSLISRKVIFGNPDKINVSLSPDGRHLSYIAPLDGVLNIFVAPVNSPSEAKPITKDKGRGIRSYYWAYNNEDIIYLQDEKGDENFRIYSLNLQTMNAKLLTPETNVKSAIYKMSHKFPNTILIGTNERDKKYFDIYKVDLGKGSKELLVNNDRFVGFTIDEDLQVRFGVIPNKDGDDEYHQFKDGKWEFFMKVDMENSMNTGFVGFDKTGKILYMLDSRNRDTGALKTLNLDNGETKLLAEDFRADVNVFTYHPTEHIIQAVGINYDRVEVKVIDDAIKEDIEYLKNLNVGDLHINKRTIDDKSWLVAYDSDIYPVKYYIYDRVSKTAKYLFSNRAELENYSLVPMYPVTIKSRDNLNLVSYLTLPKNYTLDKKQQIKNTLPLVLYVHGGPWARDNWGLNPIHQWLANRGYAVLSVNYRGSTGFGKSFINAANLQWGRKMHDDLIDAVNWAINNKIADPKKIAIMGGSYGGYATLVGLTMTPDVFACGVDLVGISNLLTFVKSFPPYWEPLLDDFKKRVGKWETQEDLKILAERSPITYVDNIIKPLFIGHGKHDPRVKEAESAQIVEAMQAKNIPVVYALYDDEGHGFARPESKLSYYALVEQFLAKVLKGAAEPIGDDLNGANFILNGKKPSNVEAENLINKAINR